MSEWVPRLSQQVATQLSREKSTKYNTTVKSIISSGDYSPLNPHTGIM